MTTKFDQQLAEILSNDFENNENNNTLLDKVIHESLVNMENKMLSEDRIIQDKEYNESLQRDLNKLKSEKKKDLNESKDLNEVDTFEELSPKSLREARLRRFEPML